MQGIDPATNILVPDPQARILRAFLNLKLIAQSEGASLQDCVRLTVYVSDLHRFAPMVDKAQAELWGKPPYPPRTMVEVQRLFESVAAAPPASAPPIERAAPAEPIPKPEPEVRPQAQAPPAPESCGCR